MKFDCIVIGAGMSGMAAAVRLAHFGKKVCLCEKHSKTGGLNSWYKIAGNPLDSGLHAMTNYATPESSPSLPLKKLLRQLRIPHEALQLRQQLSSKIVFPGRSLSFSNDFRQLRQSIAECFPSQISRFDKLDSFIMDYDGLDISAPFVSARKELKNRISDQSLIEMLLCPLMYYGSAVEEDMDFAQFSIMYKSIFHEGFCRPAAGIRTLLDTLEGRFKEAGGQIVNYKLSQDLPHAVIALNCEIRGMNASGNSIESVTLNDGTVLVADSILSSAGHAETLSLISPPDKKAVRTGQLAFVETIALLDASVSSLGHRDTIVFFNESETFSYRKPENFFDPVSGVLCSPDNFAFQDEDQVTIPQIRLTMIANHKKWFDTKEYGKMKRIVEAAAIEKIARYIHCDSIKDHVKLTDIFTPPTVRRFTGHFNGAVYGSPDKVKNGRTAYNNLFLCGTDQGFLGITGAMLSGISIANMHLLG
ncbi:MAG: NAD(P)/FAD-dependent oxidoreductase [Victivallales bacterium]|nr:NAD(P)/FAD-dependent oxidoreductase [Victivallales bacterium]